MTSSKNYSIFLFITFFFIPGVMYAYDSYTEFSRISQLHSGSLIPLIDNKNKSKIPVSFSFTLGRPVDKNQFYGDTLSNFIIQAK